MSDWWSKKLGQTTAPVPGIRLPPQQPQLPLQYHTPQDQALYYNRMPPQQQEQPQQQAPAPPSTTTKHGQLSFSDVLVSGAHGPAGRLEGHLSCPSCGSTTGYTEFSGGSGGSPGGQRATPHCFECGYNGKFSQGLESSWA